MRYMLHIIIWDVRVEEGVWEFRVGWKILIRAGRYVKYSPKYLTLFMNAPVRLSLFPKEIYIVSQLIN